MKVLDEREGHIRAVDRTDEVIWRRDHIGDG